MPECTSSSRVAKFNKAIVSRLIAEGIPGRNIRESASPLTLRTTARGASWAVMRKVSGRMRTFSMTGPDGAAIKNSATVVPPEAARRWAVGIVGELAQGNDPTPERRPVGANFREVAEQHLARYATEPTRKTKQPPRPSSITDRKQGIRLCNEIFGGVSVAALDADDVKRLTDAYAGANAKRAFVAAVAVLDLAVREGLATANPFRMPGIERPARPESRDRVPTLEEIGRVERAAAELGVGGLIVRIVLRTGLRVQAAATLEWSEIDLEAREIRLRPLPGRKIRREVVLPVGDHAADLFREIPRTEGTELIAPGRNRAGEPAIYRSWSSMYPRLRELSGVADFRSHDMRRAVVSLVAEHFDDADVLGLDKLLAHASGAGQLDSTALIYQRADFRRRMRRAMEQWDILLTRAFADNIVELRRQEVG